MAVTKSPVAKINVFCFIAPASVLILFAFAAQIIRFTVHQPTFIGGISVVVALHVASGVFGIAALTMIAAGYILRRSIQTHDANIESLREASWFAQATVDALSARIAVLDSSGCILAVNRSWREGAAAASNDPIISQISEGTNYLAVCDQLVGQGRPVAGEIAEGIRAVATGQSGEAFAEYSAVAGRETRWYLCRITRFHGNTKIRIAMSHEDITARKNAEEGADLAKREADAANHAKSAFLANMSHEIRTPMTAILGYADMLLEADQSSDERAKCVRVIRRNGEHLLGLINDVLDISKIEANKYNVEHVTCDLTHLLSDVVALTRVKASQKGLLFKVVMDGPVPKEIRTDPMRFKQVLVNLVGNAIKFTSRGSVQMRVSCQDKIVGSTLHIDVMDTGIGMAPHQIHGLFKPFTQADESTTRKFGGTGLGLVISRRFAQLLGGDIVVQSTQGVGTCFSVWVDAGPLAGVRMLPALSEQELLAPPTVVTQRAQKFAGRVLVAEDGEDNQQLILHVLKNLGLNVELAHNGLVAYETAIAQEFDLILMDMQMPELDGYGATRRLRSIGYHRPIVALTANAMADDRAKCIAAGCDDYLAKPIVGENLITILSRYLKKIVVEQSERVEAPPAAQEPSSDGQPRLRSALANNPKFRSVLERFTARLPDRIEEMRKLLRDADIEQLGRAVHQIKGAAGGYGFPEVSAAANAAMESIRASAALEAIAPQVDQLLQIIQSVEGFPQPGPVLANTAASATKATGGYRPRVDPMTGLPNREHLLERISAEIALCRREGKPLGCMVMQLVEFDQIEQQFSAPSVEGLIRRLVGIMGMRCQDDRVLFRASPSQFAILSAGSGVESMRALAQEIGDQIGAERFGDLIGEFKITCVFGLAELNLTTLCAADLLGVATGQIDQSRSIASAA